MGDPHPTDPDLIVLHTLRCIGFATEDRVATASGFAPDETKGRLANLARRSLVTNTQGPFGGWALTQEARAMTRQMLEDELELTNGRDQVRNGYQTFLRLNPLLLDVCSDGQMVRVGDRYVLNDHHDPDYDSKVLDRLMIIDAKVRMVCDDLAGRLSRGGVAS